MKDAAAQLNPYFQALVGRSMTRWKGRVVKAIGHVVESEGPAATLGESCEIVSSNGAVCEGEIVGFRGPTVLSMPLSRPDSVCYGDAVVSWGEKPSFRVGARLLGRVIDATGRSIDSGPEYSARGRWPLRQLGPPPLDRLPITEPLGCGIRAIDSFLTCGRGQRLGIFGGSGVGKSTLIGMMARGSAADLTVLALVGERGREVRDFLENAIGEEGRRRSVVIVSTSEQSPVLRIRAALAATSVAEYFCARGKNVLLVVDSLTRLAMAQREIGLSAGEPPTSKGYTPSVFTLLAQLIERAGRFNGGSITAFYSVLMEGDDQLDPIVDAVRSLLDGHILLDRRLSTESHYPPISILDSLSRLMPSVCSQEHLSKVKRLRALLASYANSEDLVRVGAYQKGLDPVLDKAITSIPAIKAFLVQRPDEKADLKTNIASLLALPD
jgi:flagellum-specific ATP synthase